MRRPEFAENTFDTAGEPSSQTVAARDPAYSFRAAGKASRTRRSARPPWRDRHCRQSTEGGYPQVILPIASDEFNNTLCLTRLGVAKSIERRHVTGYKVAAALRELFRSQTVLERCRYYATKLEGSKALENTCDYIEALK